MKNKLNKDLIEIKNYLLLNKDSDKILINKMVNLKYL
jgi:hypothetical protein